VFNRLPARVERIVPAGAHMRVIVDCGFPLVALLSAREIQDLVLAEGVMVTAHFKVNAPHLLRHAKP
jgi:ABC-type molybdate transport system ATPase subunit